MFELKLLGSSMDHETYIWEEFQIEATSFTGGMLFILGILGILGFFWDFENPKNPPFPPWKNGFAYSAVLANKEFKYLICIKVEYKTKLTVFVF